jgi:predicted nuclease of predicted toxin-antitoxin system
MKLLVDMNLSPRWVAFLLSSGVEVVHWSVIGKANAPDTEIMAYAVMNDWIVLTHDLDFSAILAVTQGEKPSVVQIRADDIDPNIIGAQVVTALKQMESELEAGALLTIDTSHIRLNLLPLQRKQ